MFLSGEAPENSVSIIAVHILIFWFYWSRCSRIVLWLARIPCWQCFSVMCSLWQFNVLLTLYRMRP